MEQLPRWIDEEPEALRAVLIELHRLRRQGVWGLRDKPAPIPELIGLAKRLFPQLGPQSQYSLIEALFRRKLLPQLDDTDREAVPLYFWLNAEPANKSPEVRRKLVAAEFFYQAGSTSRKATGFERPFLVRVATTIHDLATGKLDDVDDEEHLVFHTPYIKRNSVHETFRRLLRQGKNVVALEGEGGMGKSRLAWELALEHAGTSSEIVRLWASDENSLLTEVTDACLRLHIKSSGGTLSAALSDLLTDDYAPMFVILDNLEDGHILSLIPRPTNSSVIVTSRQSLLPPGRGGSIKVGSLKRDEAQQLIQSLRPGTSSEDEALLLQTIFGHALAIVHTCGMLNTNPDLTVQELCEAIGSYAAQVLDTAEIGYREATYTAICRETYQRLAATNPRAASVLEYIVFLDRIDGLSGARVMGFLEECMRNAYELAGNHPHVGRLMFTKARRDLLTAHLIAVRRLLGTEALIMPLLHPLTQLVLQDLLRDKAEQRCNEMLEVIEAIKARTRKEADESDDFVLRLFLIDADGALTSWLECMVKSTRATLTKKATYEQEAADIIRCYTQRVEFEKELTRLERELMTNNDEAMRQRRRKELIRPMQMELWDINFAVLRNLNTGRPLSDSEYGKLQAKLEEIEQRIETVRLELTRNAPRDPLT